MNEGLRQRLATDLAERKAQGLLRQLRPRAAHDAQLNLADNDYLGLSQHPLVIAAATQALEKWGASASASPLVTGYTTLHAELETALARWHGYPHALVMNSGYATNGAVLGGLPRAGDVVLADRLIHASIIDGILRSGARLIRFPHNDLDALELRLLEFAGREIFVVTESIYSMDGDAPDLVRLVELRKRYGFTWILDEAHATGWHGATGSGLQEEQGVKAQADIVIGTLGKSLGSQGAYMLCHAAEVRESLIHNAGEFIYSTYLAPSAAAAALAALQLIQSWETERPALHALSRAWRQGLTEIGLAIPHGHSPIIPIVLGDPLQTLRTATLLADAGFIVSAIRPPTVPSGTSRLRVSLRRGLTETQRASFTATLKGALS